MLVTPKEALNLMCVAPHSTARMNTLCKGPECMAWRWSRGGGVFKDGDIAWDDDFKPTHGHCGLIIEITNAWPVARAEVLQAENRRLKEELEKALSAPAPKPAKGG